MCTIGNACELIHDIFEETEVVYEIEGKRISNEDECVLSTWHDDINEGLYFAINTAYIDNKIINKIVCIDMTESGEKVEIIKAFDKINLGYIPEY